MSTNVMFPLLLFAEYPYEMEPAQWSIKATDNVTVINHSLEHH